MAIAAGILLMIEKKDVSETKSGADQAGFCMLQAPLFRKSDSDFRKIGISDVESNLGTAIRTAVVLVMAWLMVFITGRQNEVRKNQRQGTCFYMPFGYCHGSVVAVLLPGASGGACQCGGACG